MIGEISTFPKASQIWIFPSPILVDETIKSVIDQHLAPFIKSWQAHGKDVLGSYWIANDHFLCVAAHGDSNLPTGCAIDAMTHAVANVEKELQINLRDRSQIYFKDDSHEISKIHFSKIGENIANGRITIDTLVFQTSVNTLDEFQNNWLTTAQNSWINRFFTKKVIIS
jgi:hypothetical protein